MEKQGEKGNTGKGEKGKFSFVKVKLPRSPPLFFFTIYFLPRTWSDWWIKPCKKWRERSEEGVGR
jgi:hypothetical protein